MNFLSNETITQWAARMDLFLWGKKARPSDALKLAKAEGQDAKLSARAFARVIKANCHWYRVERTPRLCNRSRLTPAEWYFLNEWVRNHCARFPTCGDLTVACRLARRMNVKVSPSAMSESLKSMGIPLPKYPPVGTGLNYSELRAERKECKS